MPARVGARASTTTSRKSSAPPSTAPANIPEEPPLPSTSPQLRANVIAIFADAQRSIASHRKLVVRLRKIQEKCCGIATKDKKSKNSTEDGPLGEAGGVAEKEFNIEISRCVIRVLGVKKTEGAGDRIIKFLGTFLKSASDKDMEIYNQEDPDEAQGFPETATSRLIFSIVSTIVPLLGAKEKMVRFRATQIIAHIVNSLDSVDDDLYHLIRQGLLKRIRDKEPTVRVQAVQGLARLAGNEADEEEDQKNDGAAALLEKLIDILQNDASAEVRRSLLLNLPLTPETLPFLLERARDLDPPTRRALYSRLLPTLGDFRHLSLSMREKLLRWGLRDRDENVRKATGRLFRDRWIEDCAGTRNEEEGEKPGETAPPSVDALLELLERIDVVNSGIEGGTAHEAMRDFWEGRPDYRDDVTFDEEFWNSLTAESVFMARSFNDFCRGEANGKYEYLADEKLPEVTALAFYLERVTNSLLERIKLANEKGEGDEEETMEHEFIVEQLLYIALTLDYSDEVGRRKMFSLLREFLAVAELPDEITKLTVETLRSVCGPDAAGESEFCGVVLEAVAEVHDNIVTEDSFVSAKSEISDESTPTKSRKGRNRSETPDDEDEEVPFNKEEAKAKILREIMINMKCLHIAQCMLQNVEGNLQENMNLVTMLNNLVVPAVRSHEAPIRERGLECLGLCCLLDKTLAEENMTLFIHCYSKGEEPLQATALQILSDILTTHPSLLIPTASQDDSNTVTPPVYQRPLLKAFAKALKANSPQTVQTAAATSLSKLLLTNTLSPSGPDVPPAIKELNESSIETLLQSLVLSFFHPRTQTNLSLRQALAYFLPVYCHTRISNTQHMRRIAVPVVRSVLAAADEFYALEAEEDSDGDIDESVGEKEIKDLMAGVVGMLVEWTDERRVIGLGGEKILAGVPVTTTPTGNVHLALIKDILERVLGVGPWNSSGSKEERKILLSILSKVSITPPPTTTGSRASSRAPEDDPMRSSTQTRPSERGGSVAPAPMDSADEETAELALAVKDLLDQAITDGVGVDASSRNALVKVKNVVLKLVSAAEAAGVGSTTRSVKGRAATEDIAEEDEEEEAGADASVNTGIEADASVNAGTEADVTRSEIGDVEGRSQSVVSSTAEEYEDAEEETTIVG